MDSNTTQFYTELATCIKQHRQNILPPRTSTIEQVRSEVLTIVRERDEKRIKLNWQFPISVARNKMNSHYQKVHPDNLKDKETKFTMY